MSPEVNLPEVHAEVSAVFARYEDALVNNRVEALDELFWLAPQTVRYGVAENLYGYAAIAAFRAARSPAGLARTLSNTVITTFGRDFATAMTEFQREGSSRRGRQSQTWVRLREGWRVVAAHVSLIEPLPSPPAPLPEGEGSKSPQAPISEGDGSKSPPTPLPEGDGSKSTC